MQTNGRSRAFGVLVAAGILALGAIVGLVLSNLWLGLLLGALACVVWLMSFESRRGRNAGVGDEDHGIEI